MNVELVKDVLKLSAGVGIASVGAFAKWKVSKKSKKTEFASRVEDAYATLTKAKNTGAFVVTPDRNMEEWECYLLNMASKLIEMDDSQQWIMKSHSLKALKTIIESDGLCTDIDIRRTMVLSPDVIIGRIASSGSTSLIYNKYMVVRVIMHKNSYEVVIDLVPVQDISIIPQFGEDGQE